MRKLVERTKMLRLVDVEPHVFARRMVALAYEHARTVVTRLGGAELRIAEARLEASELREACEALALFAVEGKGSVRAISGHLRSLEVLTEVPGEGGLELGALEPTTELGIVVQAAKARLQIKEGVEPLSSGQLALLGSVYPQSLVRMVRSGELVPDERGQPPERGKVRSGHQFAPGTAARWLKQRGVPGF